MKKYPTWKRYLISTGETFLVTFGTTFIIMLENALSTGTVNKTILISIGMASLVTGAKAATKVIREYLTTK